MSVARGPEGGRETWQPRVRQRVEPVDDSVTRSGARSPEELETLLEDALMLGEGTAVDDLFEEGAVLAVDQMPSARGHEPIGRLALRAWREDRPYLADPLLVVQARDVALIVTEHGANVARRGHDGTWRYAIVVDTADIQLKGANT